MKEAFPGPARNWPMIPHENKNLVILIKNKSTFYYLH